MLDEKKFWKEMEKSGPNPPEIRYSEQDFEDEECECLRCLYAARKIAELMADLDKKIMNYLNDVDVDVDEDEEEEEQED